MLKYLDEPTCETPSSLLRRLLIRYLNKKERLELELQQNQSKQNNDKPKNGGMQPATYRFG